MKIDFLVEKNRLAVGVEQLSKAFKQKFETACGEVILNLEHENAIGKMTGIDLEHGVSAIVMNCTLKDDVELHFSNDGVPPIYFFFNCSNSVIVEDEKIYKEVSAATSAIFAPISDTPHKINIARNSVMKMVIIAVNRVDFIEKVLCDINSFPQQIVSLFKDTKAKETLYFQSALIPEMSQSILNLVEDSKMGLERKMEIESKTLAMINDLLKSYREEKLENTSNYKFIAEDYERVKDAKDIIIDNLNNTPTVQKIARKVGLNPTKLQIGFKLMFSKSIKQFAISAKMNQALKLLQNGKMSCGEVADTLGYTNKGHFSKKFKEEFGILPSDTYVEK
ncbi:MAG: AraC family transcriptional regulator [Saprospiraceae bacterium]